MGARQMWVVVMWMYVLARQEWEVVGAGGGEASAGGAVGTSDMPRTLLPLLWGLLPLLMG